MGGVLKAMKRLCGGDEWADSQELRVKAPLRVRQIICLFLLTGLALALVFLSWCDKCLTEPDAIKEQSHEFCQPDVHSLRISVALLREAFPPSG